MRTYSDKGRRNDERVRLGLSWQDYYLFKACEWTRLYGIPPSAMDWNVPMAKAKASPERLSRILRQQEDAIWPSASGPVNRFGSWNAFLEAARLPVRGRGERMSEHAPGGTRRSTLSGFAYGGPAPAVLVELEQLWNDDALWAENGPLAIAERMDLPAGLVLSYAERLRDAGVELRDRVLPPPPLPQSERVEVRRRTVAELWMQDYTAEEIALQVGVTRSTVQQDLSRMRREGIDLPRRSGVRSLLPDQVAVVKMLTGRGWGTDRIAQAIRLPKHRVTAAIAAEDARRTHLTQRRARVRVMLHAGMPIEAIAQRLGLAPATVEDDLRVIRRGGESKILTGHLAQPDGAA